MFRFPLRTPEMAEQSELSEKSIKPQDISGLFNKFRTEMFDCLMFLNSVTSITLCDIDPKTGNKCNVYTAQAQLSDEDRMLRQEFSEFIAHVTAKLKSGDMQVWSVPSKDVTYTLRLSDNRGYHEKWLVHQRIGFEEGTEISASLSDAFRRNDLSLLPRGGAAALLERDESDLALHPRACKAYCFLPLPIKTDLPVSINGHFALDHEARRNLWSDDDKSPKTEWNELLLERVIAPAYVEILKVVPRMLNVAHEGAHWSFMEQRGDGVPGIDRYSELFPRYVNTDCYVTTLVKGACGELLYVSVVQNQLPQCNNVACAFVSCNC